MTVSAADVKALRDETGAGMMEAKKALIEAEGDRAAATDLLRAWGAAGVAKRSGRATGEGMIAHYIHTLGPDLPPRKGVLVELNCETDFVAKTDAFKELGREIAKNIAAFEPEWISREDIPEEEIERRRKAYLESDAVQGKPEAVKEKIVEGKISAGLAEPGGVLLEQAWYKDSSKKISDLINDHAAVVKENIVVRRFARFEVGA